MSETIKRRAAPISLRLANGRVMGTNVRVTNDIPPLVAAIDIVYSVTRRGTWSDANNMLKQFPPEKFSDNQIIRKKMPGSDIIIPFVTVDNAIVLWKLMLGMSRGALMQLSVATPASIIRSNDRHENAAMVTQVDEVSVAHPLPPPVVNTEDVVTVDWNSEAYINTTSTLNQPLTAVLPDSVEDSDLDVAVPLLHQADSVSASASNSASVSPITAANMPGQVFPRWHRSFPSTHWIHTHKDPLVQRIFLELPVPLDYGNLCIWPCSQGCSCITELRKVAGSIFTAQHAAESMESLRELYRFIQCDICGELVNQPIRPARTKTSIAYLRCLGCLEKQPIDPESSNWQQCTAMRRVADCMRDFEREAHEAASVPIDICRCADLDAQSCPTPMA